MSAFRIEEGRSQTKQFDDWFPRYGLDVPERSVILRSAAMKSPERGRFLRAFFAPEAGAQKDGLAGGDLD
jgi:hypothetical protein